MPILGGFLSQLVVRVCVREREREREREKRERERGERERERESVLRRVLCYVQAMTTVPCFNAVLRVRDLVEDYAMSRLWQQFPVLMQCERCVTLAGTMYVQAITTVPCFNAV